MKAKHYATMYKERIWFLEKMLGRYYMANYNAKKAVGIGSGVCGVATLQGDEECLISHDIETLTSVIDGLSLWDCGV